jgi:hypothetical protein
MQDKIEGRIVSKQLGRFSKKEIVYGYIGIATYDGNEVAVKVDSYTWYETLEIGSHVIIDVESLGSTDIVVARKISVNDAQISNKEGVLVTT